MDLLPLGISGTLGSVSDTLGSDSGTFISVHVLTASRLISPSRFMFFRLMPHYVCLMLHRLSRHFRYLHLRTP